MYVPDLAPNDPCHALVENHIPSNVTRQSDLPNTSYNLIALAPWINSDCTRSFFQSVSKDPIRALLVYLPDGDDAQPPGATDEVWQFGQGDWTSETHFPVFAIPSAMGNEMMQQLTLYSGALSSVPFSQNLSDIYHPDSADYVRVWTELVITPEESSLPVWAFVLIIAGLLIAIIAGISFAMHCFQLNRRASLRRRVQSGDVNLEALGIQRLRVPVEHIKTFPLFTYNYDPQVWSGTTANEDAFTPQSPATAHEKYDVATDFQPVCQICLSEFVSKVSIIRELSCGHIFHPGCIDDYLSTISSLCPLCKASMLPPGFAPKITNGTVRREKATRKLRPLEEGQPENPDQPGRIRSWGSAIRSKLQGGTTVSKSPDSFELSEHDGVARPSPTATIFGRPRALPPDDHPQSQDGTPPCELALSNSTRAFD